MNRACVASGPQPRGANHFLKPLFASKRLQGSGEICAPMQVRICGEILWNDNRAKTKAGRKLAHIPDPMHSPVENSTKRREDTVQLSQRKFAVSVEGDGVSIAVAIDPFDMRIAQATLCVCVRHHDIVC